VDKNSWDFTEWKALSFVNFIYVRVGVGEIFIFKHGTIQFLTLKVKHKWFMDNFRSNFYGQTAIL
jgi:hypothetical protein